MAGPPNLLDAHRALLDAWRDAMNLVGPGPVEPHYVDCAHALAAIPPLEGHWADLGSGAGFPGIVAAARYPRLRLTLVDSRRKRCTFLREVVARGGAGDRVDVAHTRIEALAGPFDGILARALAPPPEVVAHARRLVRPGGRAVLLVGAPLADADAAGFRVSSHRYDRGEGREGWVLDLTRLRAR